MNDGSDQQRVKITDARNLDLTSLVGYLSSSSQLPASLHVRDRLLNLFLHPSIYPGRHEEGGGGDDQLELPLKGRAGWTLFTAHDARARVYAFGDVPSDLFSSEPPGTSERVPEPNEGGTDRCSCWGLFFITSPINSLITPPKEDEDPPIVDLWTSQPCRPEDANDEATALIAAIFAGFVQTEVGKWYSTTSKPNARVCFGYSVPSDIVSVLYHLAEQGKLVFKAEVDVRGRTMLLPSHKCWPEPPPPLQGFPNLILDRVRPGDVEQVWEGAHRHYSQEYIASRANISCCLRERREDFLAKSNVEQALGEDDQVILAGTRPIGWSLAHSALPIASTYVVPDWRGPKLASSPPYTRVSDFIIKHISHQIVAARLYALWACGLSSSKDSWRPTSVAEADILDPFVEGRDPAEDILAICSEVAVGNGDGDRLFGRLGFDDLSKSHKLEISWLTFSI
ncbi:hypothetical protein OC845_004782 [Tilletia horrida]|nr:hypothetical protein OC845_004782 [Tilletia horrida]